jgi:hypothetical protein
MSSGYGLNGGKFFLAPRCSNMKISGWEKVNG